MVRVSRCVSVCLCVCVGVCGSHHIQLLSTEASSHAGFGLVAVLYDRDKWGLVCDDRWDDNAAKVICTCLGYNRSASLSLCLSVCLSVFVGFYAPASSETVVETLCFLAVCASVHMLFVNMICL